VYEIKVLRIIYGHKKKEETGEWRKCHNEEGHNFHSAFKSH